MGEESTEYGIGQMVLKKSGRRAHMAPSRRLGISKFQRRVICVIGGWWRVVFGPWRSSWATETGLGYGGPRQVSIHH